MTSIYVRNRVCTVLDAHMKYNRQQKVYVQTVKYIVLAILRQAYSFVCLFVLHFIPSLSTTDNV